MAMAMPSGAELINMMINLVGMWALTEQLLTLECRTVKLWMSSKNIVAIVVLLKHIFVSSRIAFKRIF